MMMAADSKYGKEEKGSEALCGVRGFGGARLDRCRLKMDWRDMVQ